jgi:hypothetical protein
VLNQIVSDFLEGKEMIELLPLILPEEGADAYRYKRMFYRLSISPHPYDPADVA